MDGMQVIDWDLAVTTGTRLVRPGPQVSREEARQAVADLATPLAVWPKGTCASSPESTPRPRRSRRPSSTGPAGSRPTSTGFRVVLEPLDHSGWRRAPTRRRRSSSAVGLARHRASRWARCWPSWPPACSASTSCSCRRTRRVSAPAGRLTLVAPNIVNAEHELDVNPHDFRLWVCLHEETHRVQFTGVPWLREYVRSQMTEFLLASDLDLPTLLDRLAVGRRRGGRRRARRRGQPHRRHPDARAEGDPRPAHRGDDPGGGPRRLRHGRGRAVGGARRSRDIRAKFHHRREGGSRLDRTIRRLLGIDLKMKQYAEGSRLRPHGRRPRPAWTASTRSGPPRRPCRPGRDHASRALDRRVIGAPASGQRPTADPPSGGRRRPDRPAADGGRRRRRSGPDNGGMGPHPAVADVRRAVRRRWPTWRGRAGAGRVQRRRRLAGAGRRAGFRRRPGRACGRGCSPWITGCRTARPRSGPTMSPARARPGARPRRRRSPSRSARPAARRRRPGRPATRRWPRRPTRLGAGGRAARPHQGRPGRDRAARAGQGQRRAVAGGDGPRGAGRYRRPLLELAARRPRRRLRGARPAPRGTTRTTLDPRYTRVRVRARVLPVLEEELGPGVAEALARTATLCRDDADALDAWADDSGRSSGIALLAISRRSW